MYRIKSPRQVVTIPKKKKIFFFFKDLVKRDLLQMSQPSMAKSFFFQRKIKIPL